MYINHNLSCSSCYSLSHLLQVVEYMMNPDTADFMQSLITDDTTHDVDYYINHEPTYNTPSHGTTHLSVIDEDGNAIAITSTINTL